jgi:hypothetical protein
VLGELALGLGADAPRRRVGGQALRELFLDVLELAKQLVVLRVRDGRTVEIVVVVGCAGEELAELRGATTRLPARSRRGSVLRRWIVGESPGCWVPLLLFL